MEANRELLERYVELYNAGDLDACMQLYAEDAVQRMHDGTFEGVDAIRARLARDLEAFPDAKYVVESFVGRDGTFADEWTFTGTNTGPFRLPDGSEVPATGRPVEIEGMELVDVRDGKIVVDNLYYDFMAAVAQLGLVPGGGDRAIARREAHATAFEVTARLKIREGELEGFEQQAAEIMRLAREKDTKTLRYDWFVSDDGTECEVREGYVDADGLLEHDDHVAEARDRLFRDHAYDHDMTLYGEPSPALAELMERMSGHVVFNRYSFLQGLESEIPSGGRAVFEATAKLRIREGKLEGFEDQVAEIMRQMREQDEQPLRYDWFLSDDGTECEVREAYDSPDALLARQRPIAEAKARLFRECVDGHSMAFYGEPSPALIRSLEAMGTTYRRFSLFQGLEAESEAPAEVRA